MAKITYEGDDFKRMLRTDLQKLERLIAEKKVGIFEVEYKGGKIKVEIKKKGNYIVKCVVLISLKNMVRLAAILLKATTLYQ